MIRPGSEAMSNTRTRTRIPSFSRRQILDCGKCGCDAVGGEVGGGQYGPVLVGVGAGAACCGSKDSRAAVARWDVAAVEFYDEVEGGEEDLEDYVNVAGRVGWVGVC